MVAYRLLDGLSAYSNENLGVVALNFSLTLYETGSP
jgi:hypothetical protein